MDLGLSGKVALVCASTSGLGRATAASLAAEGVRVVVTGRTTERAKQVASELPGAIGIGASLTEPQGSDYLLSEIEDRVGKIDILVLNGPGPAPGPARATDGEGVDAAIGMLVQPQLALIRALLPAMLEQKWGRILSISSTSIEAPIENLSLSNLGRAALAGYLKTLATEVAAEGVSVNSLLPGRVATPRARQIDEAVSSSTGVALEEVEANSAAKIPAGHYGDPAEFGAVAAFLCSAPASYVTGTALRFDGGMVPTL